MSKGGPGKYKFGYKCAMFSLPIIIGQAFKESEQIRKEFLNIAEKYKQQKILKEKLLKEI